MNRDIPMGIMAGWVTAAALACGLFLGAMKLLEGNPMFQRAYPPEVTVDESKGSELNPDTTQVVPLANGRFMYANKMIDEER
jgi:hypothetical protein